MKVKTIRVSSSNVSICPQLKDFQFSVRGGKKAEDVHVISCQTLKTDVDRCDYLLVLSLSS